MRVTDSLLVCESNELQLNQFYRIIAAEDLILMCPEKNISGTVITTITVVYSYVI